MPGSIFPLMSAWPVRTAALSPKKSALPVAPRISAAIRRITGYLSTTDRFNDAKQAELKDRLAHKI